MFRQFVFLLLTMSVSAQFRYEHVFYPGIKSLVFNKGQQTTFRRSAGPMSQLTCHPGDGMKQKTCDEFAPSVVRCKNVGMDDTNNIVWDCEAELGDHFKFGKTVVSCEGYEHPDDPNILKGSCCLEYMLELTTSGKDYINRQKHQTPQTPQTPHTPHTPHNRHRTPYTPPRNPYIRTRSGSDNQMSFVGVMFVLMIVIWIWNMCNSPVHRHNATTTTTTVRRGRAPLISDSDIVPPSPNGGVHDEPTIRRRRNATTTTTTTVHRVPVPPVVMPPPHVVIPPPHVVMPPPHVVIPPPPPPPPPVVMAPPMVYPEPYIIPGSVRPAIIPTHPPVAPTTPPGGNTRTATGFGTTRNR
jgi:hypothetical protein